MQNMKSPSIALSDVRDTKEYWENKQRPREILTARSARKIGVADGKIRDLLEKFRRSIHYEPLCFLYIFRQFLISLLDVVIFPLALIILAIFRFTLREAKRKSSMGNLECYLPIAMGRGYHLLMVNIT